MNGERYRRVKRAVDLVTAGTLLTVGAPLLLGVGAAVRVGLGSPVLFRQRRPGRGGKPFTLFKFRTMTDARSPSGEPLADTERLTPLGRWLRRTSLDELPELLNVLRGDMSLVGPRPLLMRYQPHYRPRERLREQVRPGITGLAQVRGRNRCDWSTRLEYDAHYVENLGAGLDARIVVETLLQVVRGADVEVDPSAVMQDLDVERSAPRIQSLGAAQAADLVALHRRAFPAAELDATIFGSSGVAAYYADVLETEPGHEALGAFEGTQLLGYAHIRHLEDASHLNQIATAPRARGRGIGRALFGAWVARAQAQRRTRLTLDVREGTDAHHWYVRHGFVTQRRSCLWELRPQVTRPRHQVSFQERRGEAARHARYGFSILDARARDTDYAIGRLGPGVFRAPAHAPAEVLEALLDVRPRRTVLVAGGETPPPLESQHRSTTLRMERPTPQKEAA